MLKFNLPDWVSVVLGLVAGVLEYLNQNISQGLFHFGGPWPQVIAFGLFVLGVIGVSPLVHSAFRSALHLSPGLAAAITAVLTILAAAVTTFSLNHEVKGIILAIIAFAAFAGFGAAPQALLPK